MTDKLNNLNANLSDEEQLERYDQALIRLTDENNMIKLCNFDMGNPEIERKIKDIEFRRRLLLEKMSVSKLAQNQFNNSLVHMGIGDNVGNKIIRKFSEKWWKQIIVGLIVMLIGGFLLYKFGWI